MNSTERLTQFWRRYQRHQRAVVPPPLSRERLLTETYALIFVHSTPQELQRYYGITLPTRVRGVEETVTGSFLHLLVAQGEASLARLLIMQYGLTAADLEGLPGPSLVILTLHAFLHPGDLRPYLENHPGQFATNCSSQNTAIAIDWEALALFGELCYWGVKTYCAKNVMLKIALEIAFHAYDLTTTEIYGKGRHDALLVHHFEHKLGAVCQLLVSSGVSWGLWTAFQKIPAMWGLLYPTLHRDLMQHQRAVVIQRAWQRWRRRQQQPHQQQQRRAIRVSPRPSCPASPF